jgi:tetratricopeptide (TPR) repeat protein
VRLLLSLLLLARVAQATPPPEEEAARVHFLSGQAYYDQAAYADALREFNEAYRISQRPALLYNVALCYEHLDKYSEAIVALQQYLDASPKAEDRGSVEARIEHLKEREKQAAVSKPSPAPAVATPPKPVAASSASPPRRRVATWVVGGIGLGLLVGALASGIVAKKDYDSLKKDCGGFNCDPSQVPDAASRKSAGNAASIATDVLWPIGAAAIVTAVVLVFVEGRKPPEKRRAFLSPGGFAVALP